MVAFNSEHSLLIYHTGFGKRWVHISETGWLLGEAPARENSATMEFMARSHRGRRQRPELVLCSPLPNSAKRMAYVTTWDSPPDIKSLDGFIRSRIETPSSPHWLFGLKQITKPFQDKFTWNVEMTTFYSFWEEPYTENTSKVGDQHPA